MSKYYSVPLIAILSVTCYQNLYAHNADDNQIDYEASRKAAEEIEARENWDNFMKAVKDQETKTASEKKPNNIKSPSQQDPIPLGAQ